MSAHRERGNSEAKGSLVTRREAIIVGIGTLSTAAALAAGIKIGSGNRASPESTVTTEMPPYPFTKKDLDTLSGPAHEVRIDPANGQNQLYFRSFRPVTEVTGVYEAAYVSINGGHNWAGIDRPAANGVNQDPDIFIHSSSFGGYSSDAARHEPGQVFQVTYRDGSHGSDRDVSDVSVQLAVAGANGIEQIDLESTRMAIANNSEGVWSREAVPYQYRLDGVDAQGQHVALVVNGPPSGK